MGKRQSDSLRKTEMGWEQEVLREKSSWFIEEGWTLGFNISSKDKVSGPCHQGVSNGSTHLHNGNISGDHDKQKLRSPSSIMEYRMSFPNSSCPDRHYPKITTTAFLVTPAQIWIQFEMKKIQKDPIYVFQSL